MKPWKGEPTPDEFWAHTTRTEAGCWLWKGTVIAQSNGTPGYGYCWWRGRRDRAHRVAYELSTGLPAPTKESGHVVMHRCDTPLCVRPEHLMIGTIRMNSIDMANKGRAPQAAVAKIDEVKVRALRQMLEAGWSKRITARLVELHRATLHAIETRRTWANVE